MIDPRPDSEDTVRLLERLAAGDKAAADGLLTRHRHPMRAFVAGRLDPAIRSRVDPSDVVQDALAEVSRRLPDYLNRRPMPFHLWVRKAAYERALNLRRDHHAARRDVAREAERPDDSSLALAQSLVCRRPTPSEAAQTQEAEQQVVGALAELSDVDREILILRQIDELPYDEIAVLLDIEAASARQRYGRALIRLQKALVAHGFSAGTLE